VDKALKQLAIDERKEELIAMDSDALRRVCKKVGLDPLVKEVMVHRICKQENELGRFSRAAPTKETPKALQDIDVVDALLANESARKKERELKSQQEVVAAGKKKDFKAMSVEDLKKALAKRGLDADGKREDMIETLFAVTMQEEAVLARRSALKKMGVQELKDLLTRQGLEVGGRGEMIDTLLEHEAKRRAELQAFEEKMEEILARKREDLLGKKAVELKALCAESGLAVGGGIEDKVERLIDEARHDSAIEKTVSATIRSGRKEELLKMEKGEVLKICENMGIDPFVKEVMVELILDHEEEVGEPVAKKARARK